MDTFPIGSSSDRRQQFTPQVTHQVTPEVIPKVITRNDEYVEQLSLDSVGDLTDDHKDAIIRIDLGISLKELKEAFDFYDEDDIE